MRWRPAVSALFVIASCGVAFLAARGPAAEDPFNHPKHAKLFVSCTTCHAGAGAAGAPLYPTVAQCATCHDGRTEPAVTWKPRTAPRPSLLAFDHVAHRTEAGRRVADSLTSCASCHAEGSAPWMTVRAPVAQQCVNCHAPDAGTHLALPDSACATCHVPLSKALTLTTEQIAKFPKPRSHDAPDFQAAAAHGAAAKVTTSGGALAVSCATCHVQTYCVACHVNAPEVPAIQALGVNPAATALPPPLVAPADHGADDFEVRHATAATRNATSCQTCHTQESCAACHSAQLPPAARTLFKASAERGSGAVTRAHLPTSHAGAWEQSHGAIAQTSMQSCTTCHTRESCLACHVPDPASGSGYHPGGFLTRHPAEAYSRATSCSDCHNQGQFCQSCHQSAGVVAQRSLLGQGGYHDGNRSFFVGHGQAARQALESCASCHVERDCLTCHSVQKGRGFSPHGPNFDSERLLRKNPQLCTACHGTAIPRRQ